MFWFLCLFYCIVIVLYSNWLGNVQIAFGSALDDKYLHQCPPGERVCFILYCIVVFIVVVGSAIDCCSCCCRFYIQHCFRFIVEYILFVVQFYGNLRFEFLIEFYLFQFLFLVFADSVKNILWQPNFTSRANIFLFKIVCFFLVNKIKCTSVVVVVVGYKS